MSNLSDKTEKKALVIISKGIKVFEQLAFLNMTAEDSEAARKAQNLLRSIVESNGYNLAHKCKLVIEKQK